MRLRCNQVCPIHRSFSCCGREVVQRTRPARQLGTRRIEDPSHPRGYRELRSNVAPPSRSESFSKIFKKFQTQSIELRTAQEGRSQR
jgi:hypothetical protein